MQCKTGIHAIIWKKNKWYIQIKEEDGNIVIMNVLSDWMEDHIDHRVLKFVQNATTEHNDNDEFIKINKEKSPQDTGKKQLDIILYDKRPISMLRYIEETNEWEGLFKRIRKPAKRRRIHLVDEDEVE